MRRFAKIATFAAATIGAPGWAGSFMATTTIDAVVADFLGAAVGSPGGASRPVDARLKLAACPEALDVAWYGRGEKSLRVSCLAHSWRIFVPVNSVGAGPDTTARPAANIVQRGETVSVVFEGRGFVLTRQAEALESGAQDQWIRIRPSGDKTQPVRGQVIRPGTVRISA